MTLPEIRARSLPEANDEIVQLSPRSAVVSIGEPDAALPYGFKTMSPLHLRLEFHDVIDTGGFDARIVPPSEEHVATLLKHAPILRTADVVYCHCNAGISRSTAVAFILRTLWMGPGSEEEALRLTLEDRPNAEPNPILLRYADMLLDRNGALIRAT